jgi:hypothetical protein
MQAACRHASTDQEQPFVMTSICQEGHHCPSERAGVDP